MYWEHLPVSNVEKPVALKSPVHDLFWRRIFYSAQLPVTAFHRPSVSAWAVHTTDPSVEGKSAMHLLEKSAVPVEISASAWHSFQKHNPHKLIRLHMCLKIKKN